MDPLQIAERAMTQIMKAIDDIERKFGVTVDYPAAIWVDDKFFDVTDLFQGDNMDKKIREIEKDVKKEGAKLKDLEKMDKKRDKLVDAGKKAMKKGKC